MRPMLPSVRKILRGSHAHGLAVIAGVGMPLLAAAALALVLQPGVNTEATSALSTGPRDGTEATSALSTGPRDGTEAASALGSKPRSGTESTATSGPQPSRGAEAVASTTPQRWGRSRRRGFTDEHPAIDIQNMDYNGRFTFNRIRYRPSYWGWGPYAWGLDLYWNHDYPRAEQNLVLMLDELTLIEPNLGGGNVYEIDDPDFFKYPWAYLSEPGTWTMTDEEVESLRNYLLKGGFLVVDDMRSEQMYVLRENLERTLPGMRLEILDTTHPIFHAFFDITQQDILRQQFVYGMPVIFGVYEDNDPSKRLLVVVNYNQDVGDSWEWSNTGYVPIELSNNAYKLGINYVVYAMTH